MPTRYDAVRRIVDAELLDTGSGEHFRGHGRFERQQQLLQFLLCFVSELTLLCRLQHVAEEGQQTCKVRLHEILSLLEQKEDGVENGLVLDKVLGQGETAEPNRENLVERHGRSVLENHSGNATRGVVFGVYLIWRRR
jgi:hypothetical protein